MLSSETALGLDAVGAVVLARLALCRLTLAFGSLSGARRLKAWDQVSLTIAYQVRSAHGF